MRLRVIAAVAGVVASGALIAGCVHTPGSSVPGGPVPVTSSAAPVPAGSRSAVARPAAARTTGSGPALDTQLNSAADTLNQLDGQLKSADQTPPDTD